MEKRECAKETVYCSICSVIDAYAGNSERVKEVLLLGAAVADDLTETELPQINRLSRCHGHNANHLRIRSRDSGARMPWLTVTRFPTAQNHIFANTALINRSSSLLIGT